MSFVFTLSYKYIIRCTIGRCSIHGSLHGGIGFAFANDSVEASEEGCVLVLGVLRGINLAVGDTIEEQLQIRVSTLCQRLAVGRIVGVQSHFRLVGVRQSVAVGICHLSIEAVALQTGEERDVYLLVVLGIVTHIKRCQNVVVLQRDVRG